MRADAELQGVAPDLLRRDVQELVLARGEAVCWIRKAVEEKQEVTVAKVQLMFGILSRTGLSDREPAQIEVPPAATMSKDEIRKLTPEQLRDAFEHQVRELERTKLLARARNLHRGSTRRKCTKRRYRSDLMYRR